VPIEWKSSARGLANYVARSRKRGFGREWWRRGRRVEPEKVNHMVEGKALHKINIGASGGFGGIARRRIWWRGGGNETFNAGGEDKEVPGLSRGGVEKSETASQSKQPGWKKVKNGKRSGDRGDKLKRKGKIRCEEVKKQE